MDELQGLFEHLFGSVSQLADLLYTRTTTNVGSSFKSMSPQQWIRLVAIVGAYCLLRPYVMKMASKHQERQMEKAEEADQAAAAAAAAEISPNQLRGQVGIPEDSEDEDGAEQTQATAADWGKKARRRQRHVIKKLLDAEEERLRKLQEDEEDKDIEEYLVG
ncbi:hypothetical protein SLS62_003211 [Diatrype stigma]|uniref:Uncharacterized protein n=1 Tax=Diatrype stigma TaxID=117547 RepID=A0AAN9UX98_9PEZI